MPEWPFSKPRTTATLVRMERASRVRVTGGICVNQASKPTTGRDNLEVGVVVFARDEAGYTGPVVEGTLKTRARIKLISGLPYASTALPSPSFLNRPVSSTSINSR